jgi:2'-5' RNA ligase
VELSTAVMIVPPHSVQSVAVPIIRRYSPETLIRVPAHFTLIYPFVPAARLDEACAILYEVLAAVPTFDVTISGYAEFPGIIYIPPSDPTPIQALFRCIFEAFPDYPPYGGRFGPMLNPHLTVAEFTNEHKQREAELPAYTPITFTVQRVHVMYGYPGIALPWIAHAVIPLGGAQPR